MDTKGSIEWKISFRLNAQTYVSDRCLLLDQRVAFVDPLPQNGTERQQGRVNELWMRPTIKRFGFDALSVDQGGSYAGPGKLVLNQKYIAFLLRRIPESLLYFGVIGGGVDPVRLYRGEDPVGLLMPVRVHPIHKIEDQKLKSDRELLLLVPDLTEKAEKGDVESQELLGYIFHENCDVPTYAQQALKWMTLSAERGNADFQTRLSVFYFCGIGVPKDIAVAETWLLKAAAQNEPEACEKLGLLYGFVQDEPDPVKALIFLEKAIGLGRQTAVRFRDKLMQELGSTE